MNNNKNNSVFLDFKCDSSSNSVDDSINNCSSGSNLRKMTSVRNLNEDESGKAQSFEDFSGLVDDIDDSEDSVQEIDEIMFGFVNSDEYQLSSPSSLNSDECFYAYRGRIDIMPQNPHEHLNFQQNGLIGPLQNENQHNENDNEETDDFLEMDFDPETNSENDPQSDNINLPQHSSIHLTNHMNGQHLFDTTNKMDQYNGGGVASTSTTTANCSTLNGSSGLVNGHSSSQNDSHKTVKNTGTKPKIPSATTSNSSKSTKKHISSEDKLHLNNNYYCNSTSYGLNNPSPSTSLTFNLSNSKSNSLNNNINTLDYLSNGSNSNLLLNDSQFYNLSVENQLNNNFKYYHNYNYLQNSHHYLHNNQEHFEKQQQKDEFDLLLDIEVSRANPFPYFIHGRNLKGAGRVKPSGSTRIRGP